MTDYTELVKALRICTEHRYCSSCDFTDKTRSFPCCSIGGQTGVMLKAAAAIEALEAKVPHWVSVNDPPKFSGKVFVWRDMVGEFYDRELTFDVAYYNGLAGGRIPKGTFFQPIPGTIDYRVLDDVIYWWFPEPPQEAQDA